ncbi:hypothetical protein ACQJ0K_28585 [Priestia megaterium]|uniref:hypothetical protein n=1 Tax=Priestia megaterium TaxID=1404 RepID=UPI003CEBF4F2
MSENPVIISGKYLEGDEKELALKQVYLNSEFQLLLAELQKDVPVVEENLQMVRAYIYDASMDEQVVTGKHFTLQYLNRVQISFYSFIKGNEVYDQFYGRTVTPDERFIKVYEVNKGKVLSVATDVYEGQLEIELEQLAKHDKEFKPLSTASLITAKGFKTGCLVDEAHNKTYQYCGSGCGSCKSCTEGGGTSINSIDTCCKTHDTCWSNFGSWDHCCDKNLVNCANKYESQDNTTQNQIYLAFKASALLC